MLPELAKGLRSGNSSMQLQATTEFRKLLSFGALLFARQNLPFIWSLFLVSRWTLLNSLARFCEIIFVFCVLPNSGYELCIRYTFNCSVFNSMYLYQKKIPRFRMWLTLERYLSLYSFLLGKTAISSRYAGIMSTRLCYCYYWYECDSGIYAIALALWIMMLYQKMEITLRSPELQL